LFFSKNVSFPKIRVFNVLTIYINNSCSLSIHDFQNIIKSIPNPKVFILIVPISGQHNQAYTTCSCESWYTNFHTVHTAHVPTLHNCSQHNQAYTTCSCESWYTNFHTVHTALVPTLYDCSQHNQAYTTCGCLRSLFS